MVSFLDKKHKKWLKFFYIFEFMVVIFLLISGMSNGVLKEYHGPIAIGSISLILFNLVMILKLSQINLQKELDKTKSELQEKNAYIQSSQQHLLDSMKNLPEAIVIFNEKSIIFVNEAFKMFFQNLSGSPFEYKNAEEIHRKIIMNFTELNGATDKHFLEVKVSNVSGEDVDISAYVSKLVLDGEICHYVMIQNVTAEFKELRRAAHFQKSRMLKDLPNIPQLEFEKIYVPYYVVSGDFYYFHSTKEGELIGILGDVMGKGITAALYNSAVNILFNEALRRTNNPTKILAYMNKEVCKYLDENLVAAICFKFDMNSKMLYVSSAGVNEFIQVSDQGDISKKINRGMFLGMFEDAEFETYMTELRSGEEFYFYTDGLEQMFSETSFITSLATIQGLNGKTEYIRRTLPIPRESRKDDCTLLAYKIK